MSTATKPQNGVTTKPASVSLVEKDTEFVPFMAKDPIRLSVAIVQNFVCVKSKSGKTCDFAQAMKFIMLCKARGLNPFEGDAYLLGYDNRDGSTTFSLITAHQAFLKRAEVHPEYDGMESGVIVKLESGELFDRDGDFHLDSDTLVGGWCTVFFKGRKHHMKKRLKLTTFRKPFGRWNDDPAGMIVKCAEADALRSAFPNQLGGMYLEDELPGVAAPIPTAAPVSGQPALADLTSKLAAANQQVADEPDTIDEEPAQQVDDTPGVDVEDLYNTLSQKLECATSISDVNSARNWAKGNENDLPQAIAFNVDSMCDERIEEIRAKRGPGSNGGQKNLMDTHPNT